MLNLCVWCGSYYLWKVMLPLFIITLLEFVIFSFPPEDLEARLNITIALLFTTMATNYVVSAEIPKVDFLTSVDKIILMTLIINVLSAAANVISHHAHQHYDTFEMNTHFNLDALLGGTLFVFWVASSTMLIIPAIRRKQRSFNAWSKNPTYRAFQVGRM